MMADLRLAVDCANFTAVPTPAQVDELVRLGCEGAIVGTSYPVRGGVASAQIAAFASAGIPVEEYQFPEALRYAVRPWWLDAETGGVTVPLMRAIIAQKKPIGIYTRRGWWLTNTQNWNVKAEFPDLLLWDARYCHRDTDPCAIALAPTRVSIEAEHAMTPAFVPYGGFERAHITQWHNSVMVAGLNVDLDALEDRMYTDAQIDEKLTTIVQKLAEIQTNLTNTFNLAVRNQTRIDALEQMPEAQHPPPS